MQSNKDKGKPQSGDPKGTDGAGNKVSAEMVAPQRSSLTPGGVQDGVTRGGLVKDVKIISKLKNPHTFGLLYHNIFIH